MLLRRPLSVLASVLVFVALGSGCGSATQAEQFEDGDILFVRKETKGVAIYAMSRDGERARRVVEGDSPRWSPNGSRFAYLVDEDGELGRTGTNLWVLNSDDGEKRRVVSEDAGVSAFAWAPDGVRIAYSDGLGISVVHTETGSTERVSVDNSLGSSLDWSPDGRELLMSTTLSGLTALDVRSGAEREVASGLFTGNGRWSPDGQLVAFSESDLPRKGPTKSSIVVAQPDGGGQSRLTDGAYDSEPAWSPDGAQIYFSREPAWDFGRGDAIDALDASIRKMEIYSIDVVTRSLRRLTDNNVLDRSPDPRPTSRSLPEPPAVETGDIVVPDLVGRRVRFEDERRRFAELGLTLKRPSLTRDAQSVLLVIEQTPRGGSRVSEGTVVKLSAWDVSDPFAGRRFSSRVWKAHPDCDEDANPRGRMYSDLARRVLRRGMSKQRVFGLLGDPDSSEGRGYDWPLGYWSGFLVDCDYLRVEFDRQGGATRFYHWQS